MRWAGLIKARRARLGHRNYAVQQVASEMQSAATSRHARLATAFPEVNTVRPLAVALSITAHRAVP